MASDSQSVRESAVRDASVTETDEELFRLIAVLVPGWTLLFLIASVALVFYGDVLLSIFT